MTGPEMATAKTCDELNRWVNYFSRLDYTFIMFTAFKTLLMNMGVEEPPLLSCRR